MSEQVTVNATWLAELGRERDELQDRMAQLQRDVDNFKVRAYELGQLELHDMAIAAQRKVLAGEGEG